MIYSEIRPQFFFMHVFSLKCVGCVMFIFLRIILQCVNVFYKFIGHEFTAAYPSCSWLRAEGQQSRTD